jgi:hypothetical protein
VSSRIKHPDVEQFLILFAKIREMTDDDPEHVVSTARTDHIFRKICDRLWWCFFQLTQAEQGSRELYATTVDPQFISAWRDYNSRYSQEISSVQLMEIGIEVSGTKPRSKWEADFENAKADAQESARGIRAAFKLAEEQINQEWREFSDSFEEEIQQGLSEWRHLTNGIGFDLEGIFRRRNLVPFILIPRQISDKYGESDSLSLHKLLRQAHEAFVYGVPFAAIALSRSILEIVLRDHYKADGVDLAEQIKNAVGLPATVQRSQLHDLRVVANAILHAAATPNSVPLDLERSIVRYLFVLRDLIEGQKAEATLTRFSKRPKS